MIHPFKHYFKKRLIWLKNYLCLFIFIISDIFYLIKILFMFIYIYIYILFDKTLFMFIFIYYFVIFYLIKTLFLFIYIFNFCNNKNNYRGWSTCP